MNKNKRLTRLEQQYFPGANELYCLFGEIKFMCAYKRMYGPGKEPAPAFLRQVYDGLSERMRRTQAYHEAKGEKRT